MAITERTRGDLLIERTDRLVMVTFNRPDARNALTLQMYGELVQLCEEISSEPTVRVVVFTGQGSKAFASGTDISAFGDAADVAGSLAVEAKSVKAIEAIAALGVVTIAVINGVAAGGGLGIALACDVRVASEDARLGFPIAATLGNALGVAMTKRAVRVLGESMTRTMLLSAAMVPATRLEITGALAWTCPADELAEQAADFAAGMAYLAPGTQQATKHVLAAIEGEASMDEAGAAVAATYASEDFAKALGRFTRGERGAQFSAERPKS